MSCFVPYVKRERSDVHDESLHRATRQRKEQGEVRSMEELVSYDLRSKNVTVLQEAMKLLREEFRNNSDDHDLAEKQEDFFHVNGHDIVVRAMLDHPNSKELQMYGLRLLVCITHRNTAVRKAVAKVNGILACVAAMKQYNTDPSIIYYGLKALESLCHLDSNSEQLTHRLAAVSFLIETMKHFSEDANIIEVACGLIYQLAYCKKLRKPLLAAKAATALATAFETHMGNRNVQDAALDALNSLTGA